jgi:peptidoglycan/LPS O-acetylase OafA/YrhL
MFVLAAVFHIFRTVPLLYKTGPVLFVFASAASIAVASLSWRFIESPANALKRYFPYTLPQNRQRDAAPLGYLAD